MMMNRELIEEILKDISTPTGLSYSGDQTIANNTVDNILEFIDDLQKKAELGDHYKHLYSEVKKQKDDVVEYIKHYINFRKDIYPYIDMREFDLDKVLRMLGEGNV